MDPGCLPSVATPSKKMEQGLRMRPSRASRLASCAQKIATTLRRPFPARRFGCLQAALLLCLLAGAGGILLWRDPDKREPAHNVAGYEHEPVGETAIAPHLKARRGASSDFAVDTWKDVDAAGNRGIAPSLLRWLPLIHRGKDQVQKAEARERAYSRGWALERKSMYSKLPLRTRWRFWWADVRYSVKLWWGVSKSRWSGALRRAVDRMGDSYSKWVVKHALWGTPPPSSLWNVNELVGTPSSWAQGSRERLCEVVGPASGAQSIAIVGNGPLTADQRISIESSDLIVRFNAMNNRLEGERTDVWIVRYNSQPPLFFWGFKQLNVNESAKVVSDAKAVLFLGGPMTVHPAAYRSPVVDLLLELPDKVPPNKLLQINITGYWDHYARVLSWNWDIRFDPQAMPSSGLLGLLAVLGCVDPEQQDVHLYGFNWSNASYFMHKMGAEAVIAAQLLRQYEVQVHPVPCSGLYSCDKRCDKESYRAVVDGLPPSCGAKIQDREAREAAAVALEKERRREAIFGSERNYNKARRDEGSGSSTEFGPFFEGDFTIDDDDDDRSGRLNAGDRRFDDQVNDRQMGFAEGKGWREAVW